MSGLVHVKRRASAFVCLQCHLHMHVPAGWTSMQHAYRLCVMCLPFACSLIWSCGNYDESCGCNCSMFCLTANLDECMTREASLSKSQLVTCSGSPHVSCIHLGLRWFCSHGPRLQNYLIANLDECMTS